MRKLLFVLVYTLIVLFIGRNLNFLPQVILFQKTESSPSSLKQETKQIIDKAQGTYGVYFADFQDGSSFGINETQTFTAASVNKVPIIAALYALAHKKQIDLNQVITLQQDDIQDYGTGSLRYEQPGNTYSLRTLARLALQESDNTAVHMIGQEIGLDKVQTMVDGWGLIQTDIDDNKTSPYDMYLLFRKIYNNEITDKAHTEELLGFMKDTEFEDRIPILMPKDVTVYHKTGDSVGIIHDVGIIKKGHTCFFLAVMTSDIGDTEATTKKNIGQIAKMIYDASSSSDR